MNDLWRPSASFETLQKRGELLRNIRNYFYDTGALEVETPMLSHHATVDRFIESFTTGFQPLGSDQVTPCYLHTSPEFPMKRLLAAGSGDIYSLGKVFRNGEAGGRHNPEFTMLEWYRVGMDDHQLMSDVELLLQQIMPTSQFERHRYDHIFEQHVGINPLTASDGALQNVVLETVDKSLVGLTRADCLDLLFAHHVEPVLKGTDPWQGFFIYDYPPCMAALAQLRSNEDGHKVAGRFELYINGYEVANGYHELQDGNEQQQRFEAEQAQRRAMGLTVYPYDSHMVEALNNNLPNCAGVAMGVDRLMMLLLHTHNIKEVVAFDFARS